MPSRRYPYQIRGLDGQAITGTQGRILCPTNGAAQAASGKRARRHQRSLSASPPDPPNKPKHHLTEVRKSPLADTRLSDELLPTAFKNGDAMIRVAVGAPGMASTGSAKPTFRLNAPRI